MPENIELHSDVEAAPDARGGKGKFARDKAALVLRYVTGFFGEITAVVLGIAFVWLCAVNMLISKRVADVSFLTADASRWFSSAYEGKNAEVGKMTLAWEAADNTVIFRANDISVNSENGERLNGLTFLETELALRDVARGKIDPIRVVIDGGELSFLRDEGGNFIAGLGTPETVGEFGPVWRGQKNDGDNDLEIGRIKSLKINDGTIYIRDAGTQYFAALNSAKIEAAFLADAVVFDMAADLVREQDNSQDQAALRFKGRVSPDLQNIDTTFSGEQINPSNLLPNHPAFETLLGLNAPLSLNVHTLAGRETGLQRLDLAVAVGEGTLLRDGKENTFKSAVVLGTYDPATEMLNIDELALESELISTKGKAVLSNLGSPAEGLFSKDTRFNLGLDTLRWTGSALNIFPIDVTDVQINGQIKQNENQIVLDELYADFGTFQPRLKATLTRDEKEVLIAASIKGRVEGTVNKTQLLALWPVDRIKGARDWIERSIIKASLTNLDVRFDADEAVLAGEPLKNPDLTMTFDLADGDVRYISTMTPVTNIKGKGRVLGNQAEFTLEEGQVADVIIQQGNVSIPRVYPYGGDLVINGKATGPLKTLVTLLDQKPFEYVTPYGVNPDEFSGMGNINLSITRPLRSVITYDQVDYEVSGTLSDVSAPFAIGKNKLQNGNVVLLANRSGLSVKGPVNIGPWEADLAWREVFDNGATPTRYQVNGRLSQSELDSFGIGLREFIGGGDVILSIDAQADGLAISQANVVADLSETDMRIGPYWQKPKGAAAQMMGELSFTKDKQLTLDNFEISSAGLDLQGSLSINANYKLRDLNFTSAKIMGFIDAAAQIKPSVTQDRFEIYVTGDYLDLSPFADNAFSGGGSIDVPLLLTASIGRLALKEGYILNQSNLLLAHNGIGVTEARLKGQVKQGDVTINLNSDDEKKLRTLVMDIPDASDAVFSFFELQSLKGGRLQLNADLPVTGAQGPLTGVVRIEDVVLTNAPIMTTMLSLASLQGLADAMGGEGLKFNRFEMPFSYMDGQLSVREGRGAGPGLGMTGNGEVDFTQGVIDMDGVLVPAYTANSMLESIPLIGDIFVGKKGEGIFALNYTVKGDFGAAQVSVNPLSALTPGFLRGIFATQRDELPDQLRDQIEAVRPPSDTEETP